MYTNTDRQKGRGGGAFPATRNGTQPLDAPAGHPCFDRGQLALQPALDPGIPLLQTSWPWCERDLSANAYALLALFWTSSQQGQLPTDAAETTEPRGMCRANTLHRIANTQIRRRKGVLQTLVALFTHAITLPNGNAKKCPSLGSNTLFSTWQGLGLVGLPSLIDSIHRITPIPRIWALNYRSTRTILWSVTQTTRPVDRTHIWGVS